MLEHNKEPLCNVSVLENVIIHTHQMICVCVCACVCVFRVFANGLEDRGSIPG